jgi:hypothetical protein
MIRSSELLPEPLSPMTPIFAPEPFPFLLEPRRIIAFPRNASPLIELQNPARDVIEKISIVSDGDDCAGILLKMLFEPRDRFRVEVISRLVEQQYVRLLQQEPAQRNPAQLAARENLDRRFRRRTPERIHRHLEPAVEVPRIRRVESFLNISLLFEQRSHLVVAHRFGELLVDLVELFQQVDRFLHALFDNLSYGPGFIEVRLLFEEADGEAGRNNCLTDELLVDAGDNSE